ncbi:hypothetical protein D6827_02550 [Candidatus Parcubacteria bacterium]|nr:MAG: hypothetical protein D6827_02550 [Candidatus Parcubacteria bacterium]
MKQEQEVKKKELEKESLRPELNTIDKESKGELELSQFEAGVEDREAGEDPVEQPVKTPAASTHSALEVKDPVLKDIEDLLAEDLSDIYLSLPQEKKAAFREKGEETAAKIKNMIEAGKAKYKKILSLIRDWLKMIPGVNKFFLEQEAKIKTDKIIQYAQEQEKAL